MKPFTFNPKSLEYCEPEHVCEFDPGDCDICSACGEHTQFCEECGSECCGARSYDTDPDIDMER